MKGFTLVEVMISLFILLAGMSGVIKLQATSAAITKLSGDLTYAQNLAQTALQTQLSRPVTQVAQAGAKCIIDGSSTNSKVVTFKGIDYTINCNLTLNQTSSRLGSKAIGTTSAPSAFVEVDVTWTDLLGSQTENNHTIYSYGIVTSK